MSTATRIFLGALAGGVLGYGIYRFIGCQTGACPLTSNPYIAVAIYALLGALVAGGNNKSIKKRRAPP